MTADPRQVHLVLDLALRCGDVVMSSGGGAADTTATMLAITSAGGLRGTEVDVTFTSLTVSFQGEPDAAPETLTRQVDYRETDYTRLTVVDQVTRDYMSGAIDVVEARQLISTMWSSGRVYPRWATTSGYGTMAAGAAVLIGGDWLAAVIAFIATAVIDVLNRWTARRRIPAFYQQVTGGFVATLFAAGLGAAPFATDISASLVVAAAIIVLLAGITIVGSVQDALTGFYVTASARAFEAMLLTAGIIAGVTAGLSVVGLVGVELSVSAYVPRGLSYLATSAVAAAVVAAAFAFASSAPLRALLPIAALAGLGQLAYRPAIEAGLTPPLASAGAALVVGLLAYSAAGRFRVPPLVVVVASLAPLLPGLSIYRGLFQLGENDVTGIIPLFTAVSVAVALAAGSILGEYIAQPLKREARRLETRLAGPRLVGPLRVHRPRRERRGRRDHGTGGRTAG